MDNKENQKISFSRQEIVFFVVMNVCCIIGILLLVFRHPTQYSFIGPCPSLRFMGLYCPGCGSLRATYSFLHGDFLAIFRYNPLYIPLICCVVFLYVKRVYEFVFRTKVAFKGEMAVYKGIAIVVITFFLVRNIPISALDWSRPPEVVPIMENHKNIHGKIDCG